jgi:hypothetical protein
MLLWNISVARLLMGIVATSCTIFIDCRSLLLIDLRHIRCCLEKGFLFSCNMRQAAGGLEKVLKALGKKRKENEKN